METSALVYAPVAAILAIAIYTDLTRGKVYNWLTMSGLCAGLGLNAAVGGWSGLGHAAAGAGVAVAVWIGLSVLGRIVGAGDAKLMMAVGAFVGPKVLLWGMAYGAIAGGIIAVGIALIRSRLREQVASMASSVMLRVVAGYRMQVGGPDSLRIPYAVPLAVGVGIAMVIHGGMIP